MFCFFNNICVCFSPYAAGPNCVCVCIFALLSAHLALAALPTTRWRALLAVGRYGCRRRVLLFNRRRQPNSSERSTYILAVRQPHSWCMMRCRPYMHQTQKPKTHISRSLYCRGSHVHFSSSLQSVASRPHIVHTKYIYMWYMFMVRVSRRLVESFVGLFCCFFFVPPCRSLVKVVVSDDGARWLLLFVPHTPPIHALWQMGGASTPPPPYTRRKTIPQLLSSCWWTHMRAWCAHHLAANLWRLRTLTL